MNLTAYLGHGVNRVPDQRVEEEGSSSDPGGLTLSTLAIEGQPVSGGLGGSTSCVICRTASELARAMQRETGASLTGLGFLPLLGGKMAFFRSQRTTIFSVSVVVHAWRVSEAVRLTSPRLAAGVAAPQTEEDLRPFVQFYGDSYVNSIDVGGECIGVYTFRSETREQAERVELALKAGGLVSGLQLGAELHRTVAEASRESAINIDFHYNVWGCSEIPVLQPETLVPYALAFNGRSNIDAPVLLDLATEGYESVPQIGTAFRAVEENRKLFTRRGGLLRKYHRLRELVNQIDSVRESLTVYGLQLPEATQLAADRQRALTDLAAIDALVDAYHAAPTVPLQEPDLVSLAKGSPRIRAKVIEEPATRIGRMQGPKGQPFTFPFERNTAIQNQVRLTGMAVEAGWRVDKIWLRYSTNTAEAAVLEVIHGGDRGIKLGTPHTFGPGEGITEIYSEFGTNIDKLRIITDQGMLESTGEKGDKNNPVHWQRGPGEVVLGLIGRSDDETDGAVYALQAIVAHIEGIDWQPIDALDLEDG